MRLALATLVLLASAARGQALEGADGGVASAAPRPKKIDPRLFDEAMKNFFTGRHDQAASQLFDYVENVAPTDENFAWAQFFLGKSLLELKLTHAGAVYLARVARERTNPAVLPRTLQELQRLTDLPHDEVLIDEQVFGGLDLGFLPEEVAAYAHYQQGLLDLRVGNERWATTHFAKLPEASPEASRARYAMLVTRLKNARKDIPREMIEQFLELSKDEKLTQESRNESLLAVARLRYELGEYPAALEAYGQVKLPPLDPGRATLYLEEAWTRYQLGQVHAAMGLLTTLDAPSFREEFQPDKYLLRALVYRDLCHYLPAKRAAKELTRRFADSLEAIKEREDLTLDPRLLRAASAIGATHRAHRFLQTLELEGEQLGRHAGGFGERMFTSMTRLYDLARAEATRTYQARLKASVRDQADRLLRAAEQVRLMEYEVGLKLYERVRKGSRLVPLLSEQELAPKQVAFRFVDEYWNDELRSYRFSLRSRCLEESAP
jgi:tetratricopeptide (TPR) repeat protein